MYRSKHYLDRYSNWPIVERSHDGATGLIATLRKCSSTYGAPTELSSDRGLEFTASSTQTFLRSWCVKHRLSSTAFPHSNCRAEIGVKTIKRLLTNNTTDAGDLNTGAFQRALLQNRNTPEPETGTSPAICVFGRVIRDFIPVHPNKYLPHPTWRDVLEQREEALRNRHMKVCERLTEHTKTLQTLHVGDTVRIQNQVGPSPNKWDRTGVVAEVLPYDQYGIRVDGSGRVTVRNRKFLRKYTAAARPTNTSVPVEKLRFLIQPEQTQQKDQTHTGPEDSQNEPTTKPPMTSPPRTEPTPEITTTPKSQEPSPDAPTVRRSQRTRTQHIARQYP